MRENLCGKGRLWNVKNTLLTRWRHIVTVSSMSEDACLILTLGDLVKHSSRKCERMTLTGSAIRR